MWVLDNLWQTLSLFQTIFINQYNHFLLYQEILKVREDVRSGERRVQEGESLLQQITDSCSELQCRLDSTLQTSSSIYLQILETEQTKAEIAAQVSST